jgi:hypothetical protein|tara:strand:+ start:58 stop:279 length:222 start_codon:yes stop_codon:yes gene_type:complete
MSEETKTVTVDEVEYAVDDLSEKARYIISQMQFIMDEIDSEKRSLDRHQMSYNAFSAILKEELADVPVEVENE